MVKVGTVTGFRQFSCYNGELQKTAARLPHLQIYMVLSINGMEKMLQNYDQTNIYANPGTGTDTDNTFGAGNITNENSMGLVCPPDYRVPSKDEWDSFIQANTLGLHTLSKISTGSTVYDSGIIVTYGGKITLFLPLAGYRSYISDPLNSNFGKFLK